MSPSALPLVVTLGMPLAARADWVPLGLEGESIEEMSTNGEYVFALTSGGTVWEKSLWRVRVDGSDAPERVLEPAGGASPWTVACHPLEPDTVYVGLNGQYPVPDPVLLRSTDGGTTFEPFIAGMCDSDGGVGRIHATATSPSFLLAAADDVAHLSVSGSGSWTAAADPAGCPCGTGCGEFSRLSAARGAGDPEVLWIVNASFCFGADAYRSVDAGQSWTTMFKACETQSRIALDPVDPTRVYRFRLQDARRSVDGGETWAQMPLPDGAIEIVVDAQDPAVLYAVDGADVWVSATHGVTWNAVDTTGLPSALYIVADANVQGRVFVATVADGIYTAPLDVPAVAVEGPAPAPDAAVRLAVRPNPFETATALHIEGASAEARFDVSIYDTAGRLVRRLETPADAGATTVSWDGYDEVGLPARPGLYFATTPEGASARLVKLR